MSFSFKYQAYATSPWKNCYHIFIIKCNHLIKHIIYVTSKHSYSTNVSHKITSLTIAIYSWIHLPPFPHQTVSLVCLSQTLLVDQLACLVDYSLSLILIHHHFQFHTLRSHFLHEEKNSKCKLCARNKDQETMTVPKIKKIIIKTSLFFKKYHWVQVPS